MTVVLLGLLVLPGLVRRLERHLVKQQVVWVGRLVALIALVLLGTSGALTIYAPLQPVIGAVSLALLVGTIVWRFRLRARGGACSV